MTLKRVSMNNSGIYTCEASTEAPFFKTVSGHGEMTVIDLPDTKPHIQGGEVRGHRVGQWLDLNCSSPNSNPPAELKWYINNEPVRFKIGENGIFSQDCKK